MGLVNRIIICAYQKHNINNLFACTEIIYHDPVDPPDGGQASLLISDFN